MEDIQKANKIGSEFAQRAYPGHQAVVFTQIDGESGLIHNHFIVNMETLRGCSDDQTEWKYIELDKDDEENDKDKMIQNEWCKRQENEKIIDKNKKLPPG